MDKKLVTIVLAFISIYIIWGSTYLFNKIIVQELPPFLLAGIRFVVASLLIFIFDFLSGKAKVPSKKEFFNAGIAGFLFLTVGNGCAVWALKFVDSGFAALLISAQPMILIFMLYFLERKPILVKSMIGVVLGIVGIYLLTDQSQAAGNTNKWLGIGALFVALLSWGYGSIFVSKADLPKRHFTNTAYQMGLGGGLMLIMSVILNEPWSGLLSVSPKVVYSMIYLILFGSIVAFTSFNYLLQHVSPEKVSTSTYINPIVAMLLGWWVLDEMITQQAMLAATLLLIGVYFINSSKSKALTKSKV